jgi:predicted O-linked N-acetylglucosamine transferase (SPINDLY family)
MATISQALAIAIRHHQAGRLQAAEQICRQILQVEPNHADAIHLLGLAAHQVGKHEVAAEYIGRAIRLKANTAVFHNNLGEAYRALRRIPEAVACYRQALELKPDFVEVHVNLGNVLKDQGKLDEALACYRRALELRPDYAEAYNNLGIAFGNQGKRDEALACYRRALELKPGFAEAYNNQGDALRDQGKLDEAVACWRRALELKPDYAEAHYNLGVAFQDQGKLDEAVACYRRALELKPEFPVAHNNLGNALRDQGKLDEAVACYLRALALKPDYAMAHNNLGGALKDQGKLDGAVACYHRALELQPDCAEVHYNLANALKDQGKLDEALARYRRALQLKPDYVEAHDNLLSTLQYCAGVTPRALAEAHAEFDHQHTAPLRSAVVPHENAGGHHGRPRLGFVSPDLGQHPVGYFLVRVLESLSREQQQTICYSDRIVKDDLTLRLQAAATQWRDVIGMSDQRLAEQIRSDSVDILFDLAGHTAHNRLLTFARKPAPIQVTWLGYAGTTGLKTMDYILADHYEIPPESALYYCEKVLRMPDGYVCFDPPQDASPVGPLPSPTKGYATLGCFNNLTKITPHVIEVWAKILRRLPGARLVLKYKGWDDRSVAGRFAEMFALHAIDPGRLELVGHSPHAELLAAYHRIDLALDPFPYSGGLTTCEALWMGVPVVTCPGETFASRHSLSHLSNVGLTETIAHDLDEYVELAVSLAGDLPRLATLRGGLRQRMAASPLCDGKRFATNLMSLLQDVWEQWIG